MTRRPAVAKDHGAWVKVLAYLLKLVSAKEVNVLGIFSQIEANVALPTLRVFTPQNGNATDKRVLQWLAPPEPGTRKCRTGANDASVGKRPVHEGRAPRRFVVVPRDVRYSVVLGDARIAGPGRVAGDTDLGVGDSEPAWSVHCVRGNVADNLPAAAGGRWLAG